MNINNQFYNQENNLILDDILNTGKCQNLQKERYGKHNNKNCGSANVMITEELFQANRYRDIVESQTELICRFLIDGTLTFVNQACCRYFGQTSQELLGENFLLLIAEADRERAKKEWQFLNEDNPIVISDRQIIAANGEGRVYQWIEQAIFNNNGLLIEYQSVGRDISKVSPQKSHCYQQINTDENQQQLQNIFQSLDDVIWSIDATTWEVLYLNSAVESLYGRSLDEFVTNPNLWLEVIHPDDRVRVESVIPILFSRGTLQIEYRIIRPNGKFRWLNNRMRLIKDHTGESTVINGIITEISEHKIAEKALLANENIFQLLVEQIKDYAIYILDNHGCVLSWNIGSERIYGYKSHEIIGQHFSCFFTSDDVKLNNPEQQLHQVQKQGIYEVEGWHRRADGSLFWANVIITNLRDKSGKILGFAKITRDITEQKKAEEALRNSERLYRTMAKNFPNGAVVVFDRDLRYILADGSGLAEVGLSQESLEGKTIWEVFPPDVCATIEVDYRAALAGEKKVNEIKYQQRFYLTQTVPFKNDNGEIIGGMVVTQNITDRKNIEEALRESQEKYKTLFQIFPIGISITDKFGNLIEVNSASEEILGLSKTQHTSRTYNAPEWHIIRPDGTPMPANEFASVRSLQENRVVANVEMGIVKSETEISWINVTSAPIPLENYGVAIAYIDITERKKAEEELYYREQEIRALVENAPDIIARFDKQQRYVYVNPAIETVLGITPEMIIGKKNTELGISAEIVSIYQQKMQNLFTSKKSQIIEIDYPTPKGIISYQSRLVPEFNKNGEIISVLVMSRDITDRKQAEETLRQLAERERLLAAIAYRIRLSLELQEILDTTVAEVRQFLQCDRVLIYQFQPDWSGIMVAESVVQGWQSVLGTIVKDDYLQQTQAKSYKQGQIQLIADISQANLTKCHLELLMQFQVKANLVLPILQADNLWGLLIAQNCAKPRQWQESEVNFLSQLATQVGIATKQSQLYQQLKAVNQELHKLATVDSLTQVANRRKFDEYLEQEWRRMARKKLPLSLILCDIDFFKLYNDNYGHQGGDECLKQVAAVIRQSVKRSGDLVARYGGEEFAVILPNIDWKGAIFIAENIRDNLYNFKINHRYSRISDRVTMSIGISSCIPCYECFPNILIAAADRALYQAKAKGRDRIIYSS